MRLHSGGIAASAGASLDAADAAVVMLHGRGDSAGGILALARHLERPGVAFVAPQAAGGAWYPNTFLAPVASNEPWLSSALDTVGRVIAEIAGAGIPAERTVLLGFSQGACLASEYAARHARRYGGLVVLSGGLIGPDGTARDHAGSLGGTPVLVGCSDVDPHIPVARVHHTSAVLGRMGGVVDERIYPGFGHAVNEDEIDAARSLLGALPGARAGGRGGALP